ncbi:uncharacterized protein TRIADDRAFT_33900 [Trichoplax adhaerens]|uniref:Short/branched chain specific acyl-CoA dehydrogenase, mitochondrial n=1 Tax=Trichoplax adhaerens TaxID=10228 RepID=B3SDC7_TRIAD|nr:hypothetical protein TRIADDRAFT_33900 [Trichoplax adhaerens]EDV19266.1 hypothetical protein TRIADDRAFT_33900 [Trichoplax adhaerens]|eukprot:XP_002118263.1 hypothetical protein TRIADDRAFT_33900 [Trichoplax adhaerens]
MYSFHSNTVRKFRKEQLEPRTREFEEARDFPPDIVKQLFDQGWLGIRVPTQYDGPGADFFSAVVVIEEISKTDPALGAAVDLQNTLIAGVVLDYGSEEQKKKYLSKFANSMFGSFCLSEEGSGSDAFAMKTTALRSGDHYIINGNKLWITSAHMAGAFLVMANAAPEEGYKGITCFIVDADTPGVSVPRREEKLGQHAVSNCPVTFENVKVPASNIVGEIGSGYKIIASTLNEGRIGVAAQMVGAAQGILDHVIPYTMERKQFGKRLFDFQAMQHQIAEATVQVEAARLLAYNAARLHECNMPYVKEAAMAKYYSTEMACQIGLKGIKWMGALGYMKDFPIEKFLRDIIPGTIYEGASNVMLNTIAGRVAKEYQ